MTMYNNVILSKIFKCHAYILFYMSLLLKIIAQVSELLAPKVFPQLHNSQI